MPDTPVALTQWTATQLRSDSPALIALPGDAGFRRYYRVTGQEQPLMAVHAPPSSENTPRYLCISRMLAHGGVRVPRVLAVDETQGFLLLEDCGDQLLLPALCDETADKLYGQAFNMLEAMQAITVPTNTLEHYDHQRLWDEMALFPTWFVQHLLELPFGRHEEALLSQLFDWLIASALEQPQVLVHRDFHARNLMLHAYSTLPGELVTIDFQDAVIGPLTYDLVSLLRDCYIRWNPTRVAQWALDYRQRLLAHDRNAGTDDTQFLQWFDLMGLQRHIKVLGIFARLWLRDDKPRYLDDLPLVLAYTLEVAARYAPAAEFCEWLHSRILPACRRQRWWRELPL